MSDTFDFKPVLEGPRVTVRPIRESDWEGMFAAAGNPEVWKGHPATNRYQEPVFRAFFDDALASGSAFTFVDRESDKIIGSSRYNDFDAALSEIEIGWTFLDRGYWGGSYNAEIKKLMLDHAFGYVDTVLFWVGDTNIISMRAVEKIGGVRRDEVKVRVLNGISYPHVIYEISKG
ncbi:MAG: putative acetyltransferase [Pseudohongiella sp.]|nr:MAG: putative acetyltransferase [Pseudohongiella sp.]